jgi:hypothetical protein
LKKTKFFVFKEVVGEKKKFKLSDLAKKCDMTKDVKVEKFDFQLHFHINAPIKEKEIEQVPK